MLTVTPRTKKIMDRHIPVNHPDWEVICRRFPQPQPTQFRGFLIALGAEAVVCLLGYFVLRLTGLL
jgi:hypothetical protein